MTVRFLTFTDCFNKFISLQCRVDDSSFIWIHRLKYNRFSGLFHLVGNSSCKVFQSLLTTSSVILCITFDTDIIGFAFIYNKACQLLERIQCLSSLTDKDAHIFSFKINFQTTVCCIVF